MRLTSTLVEQTLTQFNAQAIPEDHPAAEELSRLFGEHTFFLNGSGLNIVEPTGASQAGSLAARVVKIASWQDATRTGLTRHEPEPTDVVVALEPDDPESLH